MVEGYIGNPTCCCEGCIIFEDDFNRANTEPVTGWTEVTGDSDIVAGELEVPDPGLIVADAANSLDTPRGQVTVDLPTVSAGEKYRVIINYDDEQNYLFGELETAGAGVGTLRAWERIAGSDTLIDSITTGWTSPDTMTVCRSETGLFVGNQASVVAWGCIDADNGGRQAGLSNDTGSPITYDNFRYLQSIFEEVNCPACDCQCENYCVPKTLTATLTALHACCDCMDGVEIELTYQPSELPDFIWEGTAEVCKPSICAGGYPVLDDFDLRLSCNTGECTELQWQLCTPTGTEWVGACSPWGTDGCGLFGNASKCPTSIECNPISMVFGDFTCSFTGVDDSCSFRITITE